MDIFDLPKSTKVNRVIPKNAFDGYTSTKQKRAFKDKVIRITWLYKLSPETINIRTKNISELQFFKIELKAQERIPQILKVIDRSIPYTIVFSIIYNTEYYISTSVKHIHTSNEDKSVIDFTFHTPWMKIAKSKHSVNLKHSIDEVLRDFCVQLSGLPHIENANLEEIIEQKRHVEKLQREIDQIKSKIKNTRQFNKRVELNMSLKELEQELAHLI